MYRKRGKYITVTCDFSCFLNLRLTLTDAHLEVPIAEHVIKMKTNKQKKWKLNRADVLNFLKATKGRKFNTLITYGRPMYKSIAKELNAELQLCIFHAIKKQQPRRIRRK